MARKHLNVEVEHVSAIYVPEGRRPLVEQSLPQLQDSIARLGVLVPLAVHTVAEFDIPGEGVVSNVRLLVTGRHRLEACKRLGIEHVPVVEFQDELEARLWEISENLHRAELTTQERADHIAEWVRLTDERVSAHIEPKLSSRGRTGEGRPVGGINAAVRELGIERNEAQRAVKIASIAPDAREAADAAGLTTQSARLEIAKAEDQIAKVHELAERRASKPAPAIKNAFESEEDWRRALFNVWNRGAQDWRDRAMEAMDKPVFENTRAGAA